MKKPKAKTPAESAAGRNETAAGRVSDLPPFWFELGPKV